MNTIIKTVLLGILTAAGTASFAQTKFTEGVLKYDIAISSGNPASALANSFSGATLSVYVKPGLSKTEMISTLGTETTTYDNKAGAGFILKEYSGQKLMISMTDANWKDKNKVYEELNFNIAEGFTNIGNYKCKKATAAMPDGKTLTVYFNPDIVIANKQYNNAFAQLPGLPVQYELQSGSLSFKYTLSSISYDAVLGSKFEAPKTGYRIMTYDENQQLKKS